MSKVDFSDPKLMLANAERHAKLLNDAVESWNQTGSGTFSHHSNQAKTEHWAKIIFDPEPDLESWSVIFGDCIYSVRCTLDHLVYCLAAATCPRRMKNIGSDLQFPITTSPELFFDAVRRYKLFNLSMPIVSAFERVQPYNRPHEEIPPILDILKELNNTYKHRLILPATGGVAEGASVIFHSGTFNEKPATNISMENLSSGHEVMRATFSSPQPNLKYSMDYAFHFSVNHRKGKKYERSDIRTLTSYFIEEARSIISEFESMGL